jgi:hypothetical protein
MTTEHTDAARLSLIGRRPGYSDYRQAFIPKVNRKGIVVGHRRLLIPSDDLMDIQRGLVETLLSFRIGAGPSAHAYVRGRSIKSGAAPHVGKKYTVKMDLQDFFGSIKPNMVTTPLRVANIPRHLVKSISEWCFLFNGLPQGAPSSPVLSNIAGRALDIALEGLLRTWHRRPTSREILRAHPSTGRVLLRNFRMEPIRYTRYADDLTFSSDYPNLWQIRRAVSQIVSKVGFKINPKKTRILSQPNQIKVLGVVVNSKLSTERVVRRELRAQLHNLICLAADPEVASNRLLSDKGSEAELLWNQLRGQIAHISHINEEQGISLKKQFDDAYAAHNTPEHQWPESLTTRITRYGNERINCT